MFAATALVLFLAAAPEPSAEDLDTARAKQAFSWAQKLYKQARYPEAIEKFEEAYRLKPHPSIFFNIGRCHEQLNAIPKALRSYREYLKALPEAKDKELVTDAIVNLERRLKDQGVQQLLVYTDPPGAAVSVDGKGYGASPTSIELRPGNHRVSLTKAGFEAVERSFVMPADKSMELSFGLKAGSGKAADPVAKVAPADAPKKDEPKLGLEPPPTPPPAVEVAVAKPSGRSRTWTWVAGGVAVAGLATGIGLGVTASGASSELRRAEHDQATAQGLRDNASTMGLGATVACAVAGGAAVVAVVLFFLEGRSTPSSPR